MAPAAGSQEGSLHCVTAGYFARVVGTLLFRRTGDMMRYLESHQAVLQQLVHHLDTTSIAEIVVRLMGAEEQTGMYLTPSQVRSADSPQKRRRLCVLSDSLSRGGACVGWHQIPLSR